MTKAKQNPARKTGGKSRKKTPDKGKLPRRIFAAIFLILAVWCMLPVFAGIFNIGIWLASPIFLVCAVLSLYFKKIDRRLSNKIVKAVYRVISGALLLTVIIFVALSFVMVYYIHRRPAENATVIVPGCQIIGRSPSPMLRYRLEAA
ncbi:MAG TPA: hypothetical protein DEQ02_06160 [Ruminococcaceae bacterium]|nr:hypothetical protein [Oscillospiraceae bacterium]